MTIIVEFQQSRRVWVVVLQVQIFAIRPGWFSDRKPRTRISVAQFKIDLVLRKKGEKEEEGKGRKRLGR